jgi:pyruvate dehydrogenase E2 component (dihydrolipoamide acetyltransferase)
MASDVLMPALGMAQETGRVIRWLKADGDVVARGEALLEVETDKVTVEIEAPADGTLVGVSAPEGAEVPVGTVIAVVLAEGEELAPASAVAARALAEAPLAPAAPSFPAPSAPPSSGHRRLASPKARRLAAAHGVDLDGLVGSGPNGAVVAADVDVQAIPRPAAAVAGDVGLEVGPVWQRMAERTSRAWQEVPHFALSRDVDASRLSEAREAVRRTPGCERVSLTDQLVRLCAEALRRHPRVNASWRDGTIVPGAGINVGIAVATEDGLIVPVVHDADSLSLAAISTRRQEVAAAARSGRLRPDDVDGGTFTISNLGMYGVDTFQAIVNAPQAAILAVGRIVERPVVSNGEVVVRPMFTLTASFDHRVVDGARAAEFLETLALLVEGPAGLLE